MVPPLAVSRLGVQAGPCFGQWRSCVVELRIVMSVRLPNNTNRLCDRMRIDSLLLLYSGLGRGDTHVAACIFFCFARGDRGTDLLVLPSHFRVHLATFSGCFVGCHLSTMASVVPSSVSRPGESPLRQWAAKRHRCEIAIRGFAVQSLLGVIH